MKKLLGISLVLLTVTGCSLFNSNKENSEDTTTQAVDYSNFIKVGANLLDTVDKTVSLNGVDHKLTFVYSDVVDATYKECASYYVTLLFDGRIVSSELFSQAIEDACYNVEKNKEYTEDELYNMIQFYNQHHTNQNSQNDMEKLPMDNIYEILFVSAFMAILILSKAYFFSPFGLRRLK